MQIKPIRLMRNIGYFLLDNIDSLLGRRDKLTPPRSKMFFSNPNDFKKTGEEFFQYFIELGELKSNERVLDAGCGIGRMAIPLTKYLDEEASYEGFDIVYKGIEWCQTKITPQYPNFHFQLADVFNKHYNPNGKYKAFEYKFPYEDESFDFISLTSVFTHMLPQEIENYFSEIIRVLAKNGRCLITYFLLNPDSKKLIDTNLSSRNFKYDIGGCYTTNKDTPEAAIAYDEKDILNLYEKSELSIIKPIHYGSWCGRQNFLAYQDIIIAIKK